MAMTKCKECGNKVSKKAKQCPSCGAPIKAKGGCLKGVVIIFGVFVVIGAIGSLMNPSGTGASTQTPKEKKTERSAPEKAPAPSAPSAPSAAAIAARKNLPTNRVEIAVADGKTYERCKITKVEPDGVTVMHSSGITKLSFPELPEEYRERYGYSPAEAQEYQRKIAEAKQQRETALAEQRREQQAAAADEKFKQWALDNTAVTDIAIKGPTMFVTLTADKYTNRDNVQQIADSLAKAYCMQTGKDAIVCRIYQGKREYAKGDFYR